MFLHKQDVGFGGGNRSRAHARGRQRQPQGACEEKWYHCAAAYLGTSVAARARVRQEFAQARRLGWYIAAGAQNELDWLGDRALGARNRTADVLS